MNNDLINRQEAIDIAKELTIIVKGYEMHNQAVMNYCAEIMQLPPAQSERKMGKWIKDKSWSEGAGMGESYGHYWKCNQCNNIVKGDWSQCGDNFCSNCGADMRGETNG